MSVAYSPRGLPGAPVSTPVDWPDLRRIDPAGLRLPTIPGRVRKHGDPWKGWLACAQSVEEVLLRDAGSHGQRTVEKR
jgi:DNA primase